MTTDFGTAGNTLLLVGACVTIETFEQMFYRLAGRDGSRWWYYVAPALALHACGLVGFYLLLRVAPLAVALPMIGLQYVTITFLAKARFGENVDARRWLGVIVIVVGFALIAGVLATVTRPFPILLFVALLAFDVTAFLLQKTASNHALHADTGYFHSILTHGWAWAAAALGPLQLWTWTRILARADISFAYPLTSLHVPLTMLASTVLLHERAPWQVWVGALLITTGAAILKPDGGHPPAAATLGTQTI